MGYCVAAAGARPVLPPLPLIHGALRFSRSAPSDLAVTLCFIVTFPGFFLYHSWLDLGFPAFAGGFTVAAAAAVLPIVLVAALARPRRRLVALDLWFALFLGILLVSLVAQQLQPGTEEARLRYYAVGVVWMAYYLLVRGLPTGGKTFHVVLLTSFIAICVAVVGQSEGAVFRLGVGSEEVTYQSFALLLLFCASLLVFTTRRPSVRWVYIVAAGVALGFVGARTELVLFVLVVVFFGLGGRGRWLTAFALVGTVSLAFANLDRLQDFGDSRVFDLVYTAAEGTRSERAVFLDRALSTVRAEPLLGEFGSYPPGTYAHNAVSVWVDFGLAGTVGLLTLLAWGALRVARPRRGERSEARDLRRGALVLVGCCVVALIATKAFFYSLIPLTLGLVANLDVRDSAGLSD